MKGMMTDHQLCDEINADRSEQWHEFYPLGNTPIVQAYLKRGGYGVMGHASEWYVVFADDGGRCSDPFPSAEKAMAQAEQEAADEL